MTCRRREAARAGEMDPTPERLVAQPANLPPGQTCQSVAANPGALVAAGLRPQDFPCRPDNASFRNMVSELGFAIAPNAFYPARTTGIGGFAVSIEASYTRISPDRTARRDGRSQPVLAPRHAGRAGPEHEAVLGHQQRARLGHPDLRDQGAQGPAARLRDRGQPRHDREHVDVGRRRRPPLVAHGGLSHRRARSPPRRVRRRRRAHADGHARSST